VGRKFGRKFAVVGVNFILEELAAARGEARPVLTWWIAGLTVAIAALTLIVTIDTLLID
jgi:hypothetical protein